MCGIAGAWDRSGRSTTDALADAVQRMADRLAHRGPDDAGVWADAEAGVAFGHRRLAVVDLTADGHQPMKSRSGRYVICFNGEIYNYRSIAEELDAQGVRRRGTGDTEVLIEAIDAWGLEKALQRINGMFAFSLWDRRERTLSLVRDRLGEKPLYYGRFGSMLLWGSELKALRAHQAFVADVDPDAVALFLRHKYVPAPLSIFRGVSKLPAGCVVTVRAGTEDLPAPTAYWSLLDRVTAATAPTPSDPEAVVDQLEQLLGDSIALRMRADVPLGAFLSGGIDSSTVVALMQERSSVPVRTFTIGSAVDTFDEADSARAVAEHLGTDHTELRITPEQAQDVIPLLPEMYDEPFADSSQIPTFLVSQLARRSVTVSLSGDGGDELFGGYNRYRWAPAIWGRFGGMPLTVRRGIARSLQAVPPSTWDLAAGLLPEQRRPRILGTKITKVAELMALDDPRAMYHRLVSHWTDPNELVPGANEPATLMSPTAPWPRLAGSREQMMVVDALTYLPDDILVKLDRASMAVSLESRVPLLDHRLVEFAMSVPADLKIREGTTKWPLRQVLYRRVPKSLIDRPKMGFGVPVGAWLRGPLRSWAEELLSVAAIDKAGLLESGQIRECWAAHLSGRRDETYRLWDVLCLQAWSLNEPAASGAAAGVSGSSR